MRERLTLKERSLYQNPYRKCEAFGIQSLTDAELLAVILRTGTAEKDAVEVAEELLSGHEENFLNLIDYSSRELMEFPGIGKVKAMELKAVAEIARRLSRMYYRHHFNYTDAASVAAYFMEELRHEKQEQLMVVLFDSKGGVIREKVITKGTVNQTLFAPKELFRFVIRESASLFLMIHNHPSGEPVPSRQDIQATKQIKELSLLLDVFFADHIIIGDMKYYSFRDQGLLS